MTTDRAAAAFNASSQTNAFAWDDPFLLDDQLSEEERMIRDAARAFSEAELLPRVQGAYLDEHTD
ncbi:acyl-CoA dehydrogenase, partial [Rhizobium leguminosarum bv. viciae]|nr:acyl-CoA dehydrogenase [Rhizobium leguminosarum bv. viciae]